MLVAIVLPSGDFSGESLFVWNAAIQTLGRENAEFGLRHVEPTTVLRRVMPFEAFDEAARLVGRKGLAGSKLKCTSDILSLEAEDEQGIQAVRD